MGNDRDIFIGIGMALVILDFLILLLIAIHLPRLTGIPLFICYGSRRVLRPRRPRNQRERIVQPEIPAQVEIPASQEALVQPAQPTIQPELIAEPLSEEEAQHTIDRRYTFTKPVQLPSDFDDLQLLPVDIGHLHYDALILSDELLNAWNYNLHILMMMDRLHRIQKAVLDEELKLDANHTRTEDCQEQVTQEKNPKTEETAAEAALRSRRKENVAISKAVRGEWLKWNEQARSSFAKIAAMTKKILEENDARRFHMDAAKWVIKELIGENRSLELEDGGREWEFNPTEEWDISKSGDSAHKETVRATKSSK
ncbi:hypothetical protein B7494_g2198 [Chlorociboria aeruginascens]|nr:hypothetical protein B7494_g2198 [Chlorociboria aeruginascens]